MRHLVVRSESEKSWTPSERDHECVVGCKGKDGRESEAAVARGGPEEPFSLKTPTTQYTCRYAGLHCHQFAIRCNSHRNAPSSQYRRRLDLVVTLRAIQQRRPWSRAVCFGAHDAQTWFGSLRIALCARAAEPSIKLRSPTVSLLRASPADFRSAVSGPSKRVTLSAPMNERTCGPAEYVRSACARSPPCPSMIKWPAGPAVV